MYPRLAAPIFDSNQTSSPVAISKELTVGDEMVKENGARILHGRELLLDFNLHVHGATATVYAWNDLLKLIVTKVQLQARYPKSDKIFDLFNITGKGLWFIQKLHEEVLVNDPALSSTFDADVRIVASLPFDLGPKRDLDFPNLIPIEALRKLVVNVDPSLKHANLTVVSMRVQAFVPPIELDSKLESWVCRTWREDTDFDDYVVEHRGEELLQAAYLVNTNGSNANRVISLTSDRLGLAAVDGRIMIDRWVRAHPFRDLLDDAETVATAGNYAGPLLESHQVSRSSGIRGKIKWQWSANNGPQTNTLLRCFIAQPDMTAA